MDEQKLVGMAAAGRNRVTGLASEVSVCCVLECV